MRFLVALLSCAAISCGGRMDDPQDYPGALGTSSGGSSSGSTSSSSSSSSGGPGTPVPGDPGTGDDGGAPTPIGPPTSWTITPNRGTTITFSPSLVEATRFPTVCGVMNPPFEQGDLYSLDIVGRKTMAPYNGIIVSFTSPAPPLDTPISLLVQPYVAMASGNGTAWFGAQNANGGGYDFQYSQGFGAGRDRHGSLRLGRPHPAGDAVRGRPAPDDAYPHPLRRREGARLHLRARPHLELGRVRGGLNRLAAGGKRGRRP